MHCRAIARFARFVYIINMNKQHMTDKAGNPLCENVCTSKKFELTNNREAVTCKKCLRVLSWSGVQSLLPEVIL